MLSITTDDLIAVYDQLKDRYELTLTNTAALDDGFTVDCPIIVGCAHGQIVQLYEYGGDFVLDVMDAEKTKGTHWHPNDVSSAVQDIVDFMEGNNKYSLQPFPKRNQKEVNGMNENLRPVRKVFSRIGVALCVITAVSLVAQFAWVIGSVWLLGEENWLIDSSWGMWLSTFAPMYAIGIPAGLLVLWRMPVQKPESKPLGAKRFWLSLPIVFFLMYSGNIIGTVLSMILSGGQAQNTVADMSMDTNPLKILVMVILAPLLEEYIFRKQIIDRTGKFGEKTAVIFSALTFGLFHMNLFQFFYAFGIGLVLGYLYVRTGRLRYPVAIHCIVNFMGAVIAPLVLSMVDQEALMELDPNSKEYMEVWAQMLPGLVLQFLYSTFLIGVSVAGLVLLIILRKKLTWETAEAQLPKGTGVKTVYLNVGMILFMLMCAGFIVLSLLS